MTERIPGFSTLAVHAGAQPDPTTGARATPIYQTTSFVFDDVDHAASLFGLQAFGNIYTRIGNPTSAVLEERVAALEGGTAGLAVASGHAAQVLALHCADAAGRRVRRLQASSMAARSTSSTTPSRISAGTWCGPTRTTSRRFETRDHAEDQGDLHRVDRQSRRRHHRHRGDRQDRAQGRRAADRRQHAGDALSVPAVRLRRRHRRAFADQVSRRPRQFDRRHDRRRRHLRLVAATSAIRCCREPRPEYHGMVLHETFGNFAFAIACRVLGLRDLGPALSPFNAFLILTGIETLPLRMQTPLRQCAGGRRNGCQSIRRSPGSTIRGSPATATTRSPRNTARRAPARCSPSASRAATTPASSSCRTSSCSRISPISATRAR